MGLASALSTALTGMNASETTIDVVGNNVANANTVGFKASEAVFATQFSQTLGIGSGPTAETGGTNPRQIGLGTKVAEITPDFTQGTIEISSNSSDLAIQGDGFFIVEGLQGETLYTRNGMLKTNSQNELVTVNGQRLLGLGVDEDFQLDHSEDLVPLTIPLGAAAVAQKTEIVELGGDFTPTGDLATLAEIIQSGFLSDGSALVPPDLAASSVSVVTATDTSGSTATEANVGAGAITVNGTYEYKVVMVDSFGNEGSPSDPISVTIAGAPSDVDLTGLPIPSGDFVGRRLYREDNGSGTYNMVLDEDGSSPILATATDNSAAGTTALDEQNLAEANYEYYVTYVGSGETSRPTSKISADSITTDGTRIRLDNLPPPPPGTTYTGIKIYRNLASDDDAFHELVELTAGETSYIDNALDADISGNEMINLEGPAIIGITPLVDVVQREGTTYSNIFDLGTEDSGTISFAGRKGGRTLDAKELTVTDATTVDDLLEFMQQSLGIVTSGPGIQGDPGVGVTVDGQLELSGNLGEEMAIEVGLSALKFEVGGDTDSLNLGFNSSQEATGAGAVTDFVVYDTLGIPLNVRVTTVLEARDGESTTYRWYADSPDNDDPESGNQLSVGTGTIVFDGNGLLRDVTNVQVAINRETVSSQTPLTFDFDFSSANGLNEQEASVVMKGQDGSSAGTLASYNIGNDGTLKGNFTNGASRILGQIRIARFANNAGLEQRGENLYASGVNSGLAIISDPGSQGSGTLQSGAVELSNSDIGQNLIDLILASTMYRGNTRVITAVQQLLDELLNLRR